MHSKKCYNESIIKLFWLKHKRATLIVCAALFLVALFVIKNGLPFVNKLSPEESAQKNALIYGDATVADLVSKDTDGDGVPDWEEPLWGLDPTQRETVPGVPDISTVNKLKAEGGIAVNDSGEYTENLTETDKFSRELFSTVAALNQSGTLDQATVEKISTSLLEHIKNSPQKKIFTISDIKTIGDTNTEIKKYNDTLNNTYLLYPISGNVISVLQKFIIDKDNVDTSVLSELDPIIKQTESRISAILKIPVPKSLAFFHLEFLNSGQKIIENLKNIKLYESDPMLSLGGVSQYDENVLVFTTAVQKLNTAINKELNN